MTEHEEAYYRDEPIDYRYEYMKLARQQQMETEAMIGGPSISILQSKMNPSDPFIADDFLSPYDDLTYDHPARKTLPDPVQHAAEQKAMKEEEKRRRKAKSPRMAFRRMVTGRRAAESPYDHDDFELVNSMILESQWSQEFSANIIDNNNPNPHEEDDPLMTTPLHEAARLGSGELVRCLLASGGDANTKNGGSQTAIHMCAGGFTMEEQKLVELAEKAAAESNDERQMGTEKSKKKNRHKHSSKHKQLSISIPTPSPILGIQPTVIPSESLELMRQLDSELVESPKDRKKSSSTLSGKRGLFGMMLKRRKDRKVRKDHSQRNVEDIHSPYKKDFDKNHDHKMIVKADPERLDALTTDRMEAMLALLSFVHRESGEGPSINAVDQNGRTSLHYAAELGRSDICTAMLSHFGIMLTIVDEVNLRTPCEVAAHQGHAALAAQLEARTILYIDPYGLDDEMMDLISAANEGANGNASSTYSRRNPNGRLVPPYRWFITLSNEEISHERMTILDDAREKLTEALRTPPAHEEDQEENNPSNSLEEHTPYDPWVTSDEINNDLDDQKLPASDNSYDGKELPILQDNHLESYMIHHKWDLEAALDAFRENKVEAFAAAGMPDFFDKKSEGQKTEIQTDRHCPICLDDEVEKEAWMNLRNCGHGFRRDCLVDYLTNCANDRTPFHLIKCPYHNCDCGFSKDDLESLLGIEHPEILNRILDASTDTFVTSHTNFKFCPHPGCSGIVHRFRQAKWASADYDESILNYTGAVCTACPPGTEKIGAGCTLTYEGVEDLEYSNCRSLRQPRKAHRFCFTCGEGVHWPLTCERLAEWNQRVADEIGKVDDGNGDSDFNELAQKMWLKANTRPCPKCKAPIEKNDGCNHMVCHSCHHEFCWICRQDWKLHSTETGGFFRCNIWKEDDPDRILDKKEGDDDADELTSPTNTNYNFFADSLNDQGYGSSIHTARQAWKRKQDIKRFLHHYSRWEAHKDSNILEQKMADSVCTRLAPVVEAAIDFDGSPTFNFGGKGISFIHNAFFELAECRLTLRHSYAFSFYRYPSKSFTKPSSSPPMSYLGNKRKEKFRFERLQSELEILTEQMSDIVARSHLRASQIQITYLTAGAAEKRLELNNFLFQIYREEKREAVRQKKREAEAERTAIEGNMDNELSSRYYTNPRNNPLFHRDFPNPRNNNPFHNRSSNAEIFNRLRQTYDQRFAQAATPYTTMGNLRGRDLSMQLMAQAQGLHDIEEQIRGVEDLLRSRNRNVPAFRNNTNENPRFVFIPDNESWDDDDTTTTTSTPAPPSTQMWDCPRCTFCNTGGNFCAMCETPRPR